MRRTLPRKGSHMHTEEILKHCTTIHLQGKISFGGTEQRHGMGVQRLREILQEKKGPLPTRGGGVEFVVQSNTKELEKNIEL